MFKSAAHTYKLKKIVSVLAVFISFVSCSSDDNNVQLASFSNGSVNYSEYLDHYLLSTQYKPKEFPTEENLKEIVFNKALEKMSVPEAIAEGIENDSLYVSILRNNERRLLFQKYVELEITNKIITDSLINKFYQDFTPQYRMKYIMRPFLKSSSAEFINSQKETIESAYKLLLNGKKFQDVAAEYSQDISTNQKGGDLGWVIRESMGDEALRLVMDTLSDLTYSKPFKGYGGYYIMYKGERRDVEVPPLETTKQKIWQMLFRSRKIFVEEAIDRRFDELSKKYNFLILDKIIEETFSKVTLGSQIKDSTPLYFNKLREGDKLVKIASYTDGFILLSDLFADRKKAPTNKSEFFNRLKNISQQYLLAKDAEELNMQNIVELRDQLSDMKTSLLRTILYQKVVKEKVNEELSLITDLNSENRVKKRTEIENKLREEFENKLINKYSFKFEKDNFSKALKLAYVKKEEQNKAKSKTN